MKFNKRPRRKPITPINAMSDIAFLLLIFIMVISLINYRREIKIEYPEADDYENVNADKNLEIWLNEDGKIFYNGKLVSAEAAEGIMAEAIALDPSVRIHILADRNTPYKYVNEVTEILQLLQHRVVSFVVRGVQK